MSIDQIKKIREKTGIGVLAAKTVLNKANGNVAEALTYVTEEGKRIAYQRTAKPTKASTIGLYSHGNQRVVSIVEIACETDLTASSDFFNAFANNLAMHIVAAGSLYIRREDVPDSLSKDMKAKEFDSYCKQYCLLEQTFFQDQSKTIHDLIMDFIYTHKENLEIIKFQCYRARRDL